MIRLLVPAKDTRVADDDYNSNSWMVELAQHFKRLFFDSQLSLWGVINHTLVAQLVRNATNDLTPRCCATER